MGRFKCACCEKWWSAGQSGAKKVKSESRGLITEVLKASGIEVELPIGQKICTACCSTPAHNFTFTGIKGQLVSL